MNVAIIGAGISGCTAAAVLAKQGHKVHVMEKSSKIGGLAVTVKDSQGRLYDPYGSHVFHTKNRSIWDFVNAFCKFNRYIHRKGIIIDGVCLSYPLQSRQMATRLSRNLYVKIAKELADIVSKVPVCGCNFEEVVTSMIGTTLYELMIYGYTKNQWGVEPSELFAEWAPKRIEIRDDDDDRLFRDEYQGVPREGYSSLCHAMLESSSNISLTLGLEVNNSLYSILHSYDIVLCSAPLDEILYCKKILPYRGSTFVFDHDINDKFHWENYKYGTINFSNQNVLRKMNFGVIYNKIEGEDFFLHEDMIQKFHGPICLQIGSDNGRMYPMPVVDSGRVFKELLHEAVHSDIIPIGRLGSFKYLNLDEAVLTSVNAALLVTKWKNMSIDNKVKEWIKIYGQS